MKSLDAEDYIELEEAKNSEKLKRCKCFTSFKNTPFRAGKMAKLLYDEEFYRFFKPSSC